MISKTQHIEHWKRLAEDDLPAVDALLSIKRYGAALFWLHLTFERLCKALWIKANTSNEPPKTHNLITILGQTKVVLDDEVSSFFLVMNKYQTEGRYPDILANLEHSIGLEETENILKQANPIFKWLLKQLD